MTIGFRRFVDMQFTTPWTETTLNYPAIAFATDLVMCVASQVRPSWRPRALANYVSTYFTPFNMYMRRAVLTLLRVNVDYNAKYQELSNIKPGDEQAMFAYYCEHVLKTMVIQNRDESHLFLHMLNLARMSFFFYDRGSFNAPLFAIFYISKALLVMTDKTYGEVYAKFFMLAEEVNGDEEFRYPMECDLFLLKAASIFF